jgi:CHAT domain-containing protein/tetratricopeptide (TPR) repeat protein
MPESGDERIVEELVDQVLAATIPGTGGDLPDAAREEMQILGQVIRKLPAPKQDQLFLLLKGHSDSLVRTDLHQCQALCAAMELLAAVVAEIRHQALVQRAVGNAYAIGQSDFERGLEAYDQAGKLYAGLGMELEQAVTVTGKLYALMNLGRYNQAFQEGTWAIEVLRDHQAWFDLARLTANLALLSGRLGRDLEALDLLDQAMDAYRQMGMQENEDWPYLEVNRSVVLRNLGRFDEAIAACQDAINLDEMRGEVIAAARARQNLASTYFVMGRYNEALALLDEVRRVFLDDNRIRHAMLVELFISDCLLQLRRFPEVIEKCVQARRFMDQIGSRYEVGQALLNEARANHGLQRMPQAMSSLTEARTLFAAEGNPVALAETDLLAAKLMLEQGQPEQALPLAQACALVYQQHGLPVWEASARQVACRAALARGDRELAEELIGELRRLVAEQNLPNLAYPEYQLEAELALGRGDLTAALAAYEQAMSTLERLVGAMMIEYRAGFVEDKTDLYESAVDVCLKLDQPERGLQIAERAKSRSLLDMLAHRLDLGILARSPQDQPLVDELAALHSRRNQLMRRWQAGEGFGQRGSASLPLEGDLDARQALFATEKTITELWHQLLVRNADYAREASLWQVRAEPIQPYLDPETVLVEYFSVQEKLVVFLASREEVHAVRLPGDFSQACRLVQLMWLNLHSVAATPAENIPGLTRNLNGILQRLYAQLVKPLEGYLEGVRNLLVVPHAALHYLPFHALHDGQRHLLERFDFSYLPGSSLLRYCLETRPDGGSPLVFGHSYHGRLPFTLEEARLVADIYNQTAFLEAAATLDSFRQKAANASLLHLAAHGDFRPDNPLFSGLALQDGWLTTLDIFNLHLSADLVTLSACQTGRSVVGGGDELLGLMRAFLAAGAASLVASLWAVDDLSTAQLMEVFYHELVAGGSRRSALGTAQRQLLQDTALPDRYRHPYYWAPFFLVGNPDPL